MQTINILDFSVANLIAAGEVVDRPASVVKELIENAVDAGAKEITVEIRRGGVGYVRVTDNGKGMSRDDAEICILRHATSKIRNAEDLDAITTLGFRGEALAAISSVCQMSIVTKRAADETGTQVLCDCGRITEVGDVGTKNGTTVIVKELFANVPARRKFLKRDQSEGMACAAVVEKEAMAHPEIAFTFQSDATVRLKTTGDGKLFNAIYALLGRDFANKLIKVNGKSEAVDVFGYIGRPDNVRANRNYQNFFINGRYVKSRTATAAVEQAYSSFMESEKFPCCVLNIVIHPSLVDVNVHPTKLEVKFSNEKVIFDAVYLAVRNALLTDMTRPEMQLEKKDISHKAIETYNSFAPVYDRIDGEKSEQTAFFRRPETAEAVESRPGTGTDAKKAPYDDLPFVFEDLVRQIERESAPSPEAGTNGASAAPADTAKRASAEAGTPVSDACRIPGTPSGRGGFRMPTFEGEALTFEKETQRTGAAPLSEDAGNVGDIKDNAVSTDTQTSAGGEDDRKIGEDGFKLLGVAFDTYILAQIGDKLMIIDKHAAHERLLFEKMKANMARSDARATQLLLIPETLHVGYEERNAAIAYKPELEAAGYTFTTEEFGSTVELTGIPGQVDKETALAVFEEMLSKLSSGEGDVEVSRQNGFERALYTASCKAAMKGGRNDGDEHAEYLIRELLRLPDIRYCPHGRPVAFEIPKGSIEHKFKRS
ncbi:MAG: DNA mismatch repair endonuclease MutL [Clostridia bacterium]|nr:DNA mismatch repair endonuclease MutL [Clostridia bacterium]